MLEAGTFPGPSRDSKSSYVMVKWDTQGGLEERARGHARVIAPALATAAS